MNPYIRGAADQFCWHLSGVCRYSDSRYCH
ncbi:hypothetical protein D0784_10745 [Vibrio campbellii]|nr:hypothetical protein D0784_10745 [Vibrio campbellii]